MREVLCAMAVCWGVCLTGCVALTDGATQVTQTSAQLNAHGHTDDSPAHYYFRYANQEADLPTAAAQRTPRRDVPAHVGRPGYDVAFHEDVTGLSPGRVYIFEVCGGDSASAPDWCGGRQQFFTDPSAGQDTVEASFGEPNSTSPFPPFHTIDAASGPQGQNGDGFTEVTSKNYRLFFGRVSCLKIIAGRQAAVGVVGTAYYGWPGTISFSTPPRPYGMLYTFTTPLFQPNTFAFREQSPPDCEHADYSNQTQGSDVVIRDVN